MTTRRPKSSRAETCRASSSPWSSQLGKQGTAFFTRQGGQIDTTRSTSHHLPDRARLPCYLVHVLAPNPLHKVPQGADQNRFSSGRLKPSCRRAPRSKSERQTAGFGPLSPVLN